MSEHREKAVEAVRESLRSTWGRDRQTTDWPTDQHYADALQAADKDLERMYFERFEAQVNEEAADFASQLEDLASIVNSPTGNHEAVGEDLNRIACELAALQPSSLATHLAKERERFKEAVLSNEAHEAALDAYVRKTGRASDRGTEASLQAALSKAQQLMEEGE